MQAIIFTGIQASGKTSYYKENFFDTHVRISLDLLKSRHRESRFLATCTDTRTRFVVDNTNPTVQDRARYIAIARTAHYEVIGYYFETTLEAALVRNSKRPGKHIVRDQGIRATFRKLQPPTLSEGFDTLYTVTLADNNSWTVTCLTS